MGKLGVLTSGGDAPGMNAALKHIHTLAEEEGTEVLSALEGYKGLYGGDFAKFTAESLDPYVGRGGSIIRCSRFPEFADPGIRRKAVYNLINNKIDKLIVIGGDGSFRGLSALSKETDTAMVGIPGTIDNDLDCTHYTLGFDSAVDGNVNTFVPWDRDANYSQGRVVIAEVMGRHCGRLAHEVAKRSNADILIAPELGLSKSEMKQHVFREILHLQEIGQRDITIVAAENFLDLEQLAKEIREVTGQECKLCVHSQAQRGAPATSIDQEYARRFSEMAVLAPQKHQAQVVTVNPEGEMGIKSIEGAISEGSRERSVYQMPRRTEPYISDYMEMAEKFRVRDVESTIGD